MGIGIWELVLILAIILVLFGAGKLPKVMSDIGRGIKTLRDELKDKDKDNDAKKNKDEENKENKL